MRILAGGPSRGTETAIPFIKNILSEIIKFFVSRTKFSPTLSHRFKNNDTGRSQKDFYLKYF